MRCTKSARRMLFLGSTVFTQSQGMWFLSTSKAEKTRLWRKLLNYYHLRLWSVLQPLLLWQISSIVMVFKEMGGKKRRGGLLRVIVQCSCKMYRVGFAISASVRGLSQHCPSKETNLLPPQGSARKRNLVCSFMVSLSYCGICSGKWCSWEECSILKVKGNLLSNTSHCTFLLGVGKRTFVYSVSQQQLNQRMGEKNHKWLLSILILFNEGGNFANSVWVF